MSECRDLEEFIYGPDGDQERNVAAALGDAFEAARAEGLDRIRIECSTSPSGVSRSQTEWNRSTGIDDPVELVRDAVANALRDAPGEGFCGRIRLRFIDSNDSTSKIGSYTRTMRPGFAISPADADPNIQNGTGSLRAHFDDAVRPAMEMMLRFADKNIAMAHAMTSTWQTNAGAVPMEPPPDNGPDNSLLATLMQGALSVAGAANERDRATAAANTVVQTATYVPPQPQPVRQPAPRVVRPPPSPLNPPRLPDYRTPLLDNRASQPQQHTDASNTRPSSAIDPTKLTTEQVTEWAKANPDAAKQLVMAAMMQGQKL